MMLVGPSQREDNKSGLLECSTRYLRHACRGEEPLRVRVINLDGPHAQTASQSSIIPSVSRIFDLFRMT